MRRAATVGCEARRVTRICGTARSDWSDNERTWSVLRARATLPTERRKLACPLVRAARRRAFASLSATCSVHRCRDADACAAHVRRTTARALRCCCCASVHSARHAATPSQPRHRVYCDRGSARRNGVSRHHARKHRASRSRSSKIGPVSWAGRFRPVLVGDAPRGNRSQINSRPIRSAFDHEFARACSRRSHLP